MISKKYSAEFKIGLVEKYLSEREKSNISKAAFAAKHNVSDSTFNDWVLKYERQGSGFCNITNEVIKLNNVEIVDYRKDIIVPVEQNKFEPTSDMMRLHYNVNKINLNQHQI